MILLCQEQSQSYICECQAVFLHLGGAEEVPRSERNPYNITYLELHSKMKYKLIISTKKLNTFLVVVLYRLLLDFCYFQFISKKYNYYGFQDNRTLLNLALSWFILIITYFLFSGIAAPENDRNSSIILLVLYLLSFIPFTTCIYAGIFVKGYIVYNCIYWFGIIFMQNLSQLIPVKKIPRIKFKNIVFNDKFVEILGGVSLLIVLYISWRYTRFRLNFNLFSVYAIRLEAREYKLPTILSYLFAWTRAINPVLFAYCLLKNKKSMAFLYFLVQMLSFGIDGLKSTFFMPFLVFIVIIYYKKVSSGKFKKMLLMGITGITLISVMEYVFFRSFFLLELIVRRIMFVPNYLNHCYYDFFQTHTPDYFRSSFLRFFGFTSPYTNNSRGLTYIIGATYFGRPNMNCNNGLVSDAITNFGNLGMLLMPIVLITVLRLFDCSTEGLDKRLSVASALYLAYVILSTFIMPVLLTHGMLILIFLLSMMDPTQAEVAIVQNNQDEYLDTEQ